MHSTVAEKLAKKLMEWNKEKGKHTEQKPTQFYGPPMKLTVHEVSCVQAYGHF